MTDSELVRALQQGDREVFADLVSRHREMVQSLCYRIAGNRLDAEELAHDTFVEAYLKIGMLREPEKLGGWLRAIALNVCRMWYRRRKRDREELPADIAAAEADAEDAALLARMSLGLSQLAAPQRLVLVLHYFEQLSYEQIAEFLDIPTGTVMSRLHRARAALRQVLEGPVSDEEMPVSNDDRFQEEVQAEIAVLLEMFGRDSGASERLTIILQHSPQRFKQLIAEAEAEPMRANLAVLLPRLGGEAMTAALDAALSPDPRAAGRANDVLRRFLRGYKSGEEPGRDPHTPAHGTYVLMDRLTRHPAESHVKTELLVDLLDSCRDNSPFSAVAALVTNVLLCYPEAAFSALVQWFDEVTGKDGLYDSAWRLFALCRTGTRFCRKVADCLASSDTARQVVGLAAAEAVGRCLDIEWLREAAPASLAFDVRFRAKWPALRSEDLDRGVLAEMVEKTAGLLDHSRAEIRDGALAALGRMRAVEYVKRIVPHAVHEDACTRLAAIRALGDIGDPSAGSVLMHIARGPDPTAVRRAAVETLGRLKVPEAQDLLVGLLDDADAQMQEAAAAALAELETPAAQAALHDLLSSGSKRLQKVVARIVFSRQHARRTAGPPRRPTQSQRLRGDAQTVCYSSIAPVLRMALPEIRPYEERDLTGRIAGVCIDYSLTRRRLVDEGWMIREAGTYELTEVGQAAWRVEQFIREHYSR